MCAYLLESSKCTQRKLTGGGTPISTQEAVDEVDFDLEDCGLAELKERIYKTAAATLKKEQVKGFEGGYDIAMQKHLKKPSGTNGG
jgi:hypothetical protein